MFARLVLPLGLVSVALAQPAAKAPATTPGTDAATPAIKDRGRVEGCVVAEKLDDAPGVSGLRVTDPRVIEPPVVGAKGLVAVSLSEVSGRGNWAYPAVRPFSDDAHVGDPVQLYGIAPCSRMEFMFPIEPKARVKAGDSIEVGFQAANLACLRGDYPCDGQIVKTRVKVVARAGKPSP